MQTNLLTIQQKLYEKTIAFMQQQNETVPHEIRVREIVQKFLNQEQLFVPKNIFQRLLESITFAIIGFGPLEFLLRDDDVSEIMVNGFSSVFVEKNGSIEKTCFSFLNEKQLIQTINRIVGKVGRRIDESHPLVDARLADGSRVNAIIPPLSLCGATLTIRKFPKKIFVISDMLNRNSLTQKMADFLETAVVSKQNIIIQHNRMCFIITMATRRNKGIGQSQRVSMHYELSWMRIANIRYLQRRIIVDSVNSYAATFESRLSKYTLSS